MPDPHIQLSSQSLAIKQVRALIHKTALREEEINSEVSEKKAIAINTRNESISELEKRIDTHRAETLNLKETSVKKIEKRKAEEPYILKEKHEQRIIEINTQAEEFAEQSEVKLNEAIWLAESVYEGAIPIPRKKAKIYWCNTCWMERCF